jgi:molybdopterin synthase sulfur carrier subunit
MRRGRAEKIESAHCRLRSVWTSSNRSARMLTSDMTTFQIAGYLTEFAGGQAEIKLEGAPNNVGEALDQLWSEHAGLRDRVLTEQGQVRPHVNVFVNSQVVRRDQVLQSPISGDAEICIMPAVSGGDLMFGSTIN